MQEDLRQFVLRRFIEEKRRIQKQLRQDSEERQRIDLEKATLEGITLDDPTINEVPTIDDMQTVESDNPSFAQTSSLTPEARSSVPETRPANKVGTLAMCKIASIQQGRPSSTHKLIQVRSKIAIERQRLATFEEELIGLTP